MSKKKESRKGLALFPFLLFCLLTLSSSVHDYHVSVTQMQYNPAIRTFEVSIRMFTDDLEKGLTQGNDKQRVVIKNDDKNDPLVERYVLKSFVLMDSQKKPVAIKYVGKEQEEDATWVYLEIPFQGPLNGYKLQNSTLMEVFDDQVNMTNIKNASEKRTFLFKKGQTVHIL
ncbi:DUF6702 family protein [Dyadobacter sp. CY326]|uniref:DUF6702 family protein n=1 Tax=Dyadobacter sp. CY326 TaxID=2907300 RepID=UPI001F40A1CF|nr:DUF6702 family protein [Dyadobacter sp. CY326]MCE7067310.1 hypothetical protein [Dyadobacter sp. CY326]